MQINAVMIAIKPGIFDIIFTKFDQTMIRNYLLKIKGTEYAASSNHAEHRRKSMNVVEKKTKVTQITGSKDAATKASEILNDQQMTLLSDKKIYVKVRNKLIQAKAYKKDDAPVMQPQIVLADPTLLKKKGATPAKTQDQKRESYMYLKELQKCGTRCFGEIEKDYQEHKKLLKDANKNKFDDLALGKKTRNNAKKEIVDDTQHLIKKFDRNAEFYNNYKINGHTRDRSYFTARNSQTARRANLGSDNNESMYN